MLKDTTDEGEQLIKPNSLACVYTIFDSTTHSTLKKVKVMSSDLVHTISITNTTTEVKLCTIIF